MKKFFASVILVGVLCLPFFVSADDIVDEDGEIINTPTTGTGEINNTPTTGTGNTSNPATPLQNSGRSPSITNPSSSGGGSLNNPPPTVAKLENPLGGTNGINSLDGLFIKLVNIIVGISYAVVAVFLIYSGFKFITAQGVPQKLEDAKKTFWYTIVGALLIIGAQTIATVLQNLIKSLNS